MKRLGLRLKFALVIVLLFAAIFGAIAAILIRQNSNSLRDDLNARSKLFAALATTPIGNAFLTYQDSGQIKITQQIQAFTALNSEITDVAVVDTSGAVAFNQDSNQAVTLDNQTASSFTTVYSQSKDGIITRIVVPLIEDNGSHQYNLVYFVSSNSVVKAIHHTETSILISVIIGLLASIGLTYVLTSQIFVRPISRVSAQALSISSGHFDQQVQVKSRDEVGDLAKAVNDMAESLKGDIAKLRETDRLKTEFLMITSHNLRTPLTIINGYLEQLHETKVDADLKQIFDTMAVSGRRLSAFAEDMLTISQIESGENAFQKEPTKLTKLLEGMAADFAILAKEKGVKFTAGIVTGDHEANISAAHVRSALWNLLDNAIKFTKPGGWIRLDAAIVAGTVQIVVADSGIGISPEEMAKLFTKFHRGTSTWDYEYEGTGIGLYATKLVIDRLGGSIKADSELGKGSTFTITLPIMTPPAVASPAPPVPVKP